MHDEVVGTQIDDALVMEDARVYWPGNSAEEELARKLVSACLEMADRGGSWCGARNGLMAPVLLSDLGACLSGRRLLAKANTKLLRSLEQHQQSGIFKLDHTEREIWSVSLNVVALQCAARRSRQLSSGSEQLAARAPVVAAVPCKVTSDTEIR